MKWTLFKVISYLSIFLFTEGVFLPWMMDTHSKPTWSLILLTTLAVISAVGLIDSLTRLLIKTFRRDHEPTG